MIVKTSAIALRTDPFSRTSQIVSWLTPDHGRVVTLAKGAQRPRNDLRGQIDVFYTCEILYYGASRSVLSPIRECTALATREALRSSIEASACASYLCALIQRLTPLGAPQERLFQFLERCLDALCNMTTGVPLRLFHWAELHLMGLWGMAPKLDRCTSCGRRQGTGEPLNVIAIQRGGVVCTQCRPTAEGPVVSLGLDCVAILKSWQESELPLRACRTACTLEQRTAINRSLEALLTYHLEVPQARQIALGLLGC